MVQKKKLPAKSAAAVKAQKSVAKAAQPLKAVSAKTVPKKETQRLAVKAAPVRATKPAAKPIVKAAPAKAAEVKAAPAQKPQTQKVPFKPMAAVKTAPVKTVAAAKPVAGKPAPIAKAAVAAKPVAAAKTATTVKPAAPGKAPVAAGKAAPAGKAPVASQAVAPKPAVARTQIASQVAALQAHRAATQPQPQRAMPATVTAKPGQKIVSPATPKQVAEKAAAAQASASKKPVNARHGFKTNEWIVYPSHGVGRIVGIEEQEIAGMSLELFVITFEKDKMTLRVPTGKSASVGMRKLSEDNTVKRAMETLKGRARVKRTMWSRRAQEYEAKINSGDLISIAEVVRDLYRSDNQPEQSYSERQLYEAALDRMAREIAAVDKLDERGAAQKITEVLSKSAKGRRQAAEEAAAEADGDDAQIKAA
jgi:CarD family transcriptional regulator